MDRESGLAILARRLSTLTTFLDGQASWLNSRWAAGTLFRVSTGCDIWLASWGRRGNVLSTATSTSASSICTSLYNWWTRSAPGSTSETWTLLLLHVAAAPSIGFSFLKMLGSSASAKLFSWLILLTTTSSIVIAKHAIFLALQWREDMTLSILISSAILG